MTVSKRITTLVSALLLVLVTGGAAIAAPRPVVLELFTSHGCSSCPPADALLRKLPDSPPVANIKLIRLSEHVTYWNDLGWVDRFSDGQFTQRQRDYAHKVFGSGRVYTPQLVVNGQHEMVGSRSGEVNEAIRKAADEATVPVSIKLTPKSGSVDVVATVDGSRQGGASTVWLAVTQNNAVSSIGAGENSGRRLREDGVVRVLRSAGDYPANAGAAKRFSSTLVLPDDVSADDLSVVAFVQRQDSHAIVGAAQQPLTSRQAAR